MSDKTDFEQEDNSEQVLNMASQPSNDMVHLTPEERQERLLKCRSLKEQGNSKFKENNLEEAVALYSQAIELCPSDETKEKSVLYNNRGAAFSHMDDDEFQEKCIQDCSSSIELNPDYVKPYLKRAQTLRKLGNKEKLDQALEDYQTVVTLDPSYKDAYPIIEQLKDEINKRNEEFKDEMIGKLKNLGNVVLNKFGLSTDNFQMVQNPDTGSYSINFKK